MTNYIKPFGFRRNLDYLRVNLFILWKKIIEYKANFFSYGIEHLIYMGSFLFFIVFSNNFFYAWNIC
jgi:hypothetical protein